MNLHNIRFFSLVAIMCCFCTFIACKSSKKSTKDTKTELSDRQIAKAKRMLNPIISGESKLSLAEQWKVVNEVKSWELTDADVLSKIKEAEQKLKSQKSRKKPKKSNTKSSLNSKLNSNFEKIAESNNYNKSKQLINSTLRHFTSKSTPVLIIISSHAGVVDYDKPTTIEYYLNYLKDINESPNKVHDIVYDNDKKISELVLIAK